MARLIAVVDLPTPPLPEATAMIDFTPGTSAACAWRCPPPSAGGGGAAGRPPGARSAVSTAVQDKTPGRAAHRLLASLAQLFEPRRLGRLDLDRESDTTVLHHHPGNHAETDDIVIPLRMADLAQGCQHLLGGDLVHG